MEEGQDETRKKSERVNRGLPPHRYGEWEAEQSPFTSAEPFDKVTSLDRSAQDDILSMHSKVSSCRSKASNVSKSSIRRQRVEAQLEAAKRDAELEAEEEELQRRRIARQRDINRKELELRLARVEEEAELVDNSQDLDDDKDGRKPPLSSSPRPIGNERVDMGGVGDHPATAPSHRASPAQAVNEDTSPTQTLAHALTQALRSVGHQPSNTGTGSIESARRTIGRELTLFGGNPEEWPAFISEYTECTELCNFSDRENLQRLRKSLKGKAKEAVQALLTAPNNVKKIMETLELRFGRAEHIVEALIEKVRRLPAVKEDKFEGIIDFSTAVQNLATTIESLGCTNHLSNPQLVKDLFGKLPSNWKTDWSLNIGNKGLITVTDLAEWLSERARALSRMMPPAFSAEPYSGKVDKKDSFKRKDAILTTVDNQKRTDQNKCLFCERKGHLLGKCRSFIDADLDTRWAFAREKRVCFSCLQPGHRSSKCKNKRECGKEGCSKPHHQFLHYRNNKDSTFSSKTDEEESQSHPEGTDTTLRNFHQSTIDRNNILYKVLPVILKGPRRDLSTYALLDEASAFTLIDADVADYLEITGSKAPLSIKGVGNISSTDKESQSIALEISGIKNKKSYTIRNARTKKNLGMPVQTVDLKNLPTEWEGLRKVGILTMKDAKPVMLIGLDNIDLIATVKLKRGPRNTVVLGKTRLGWSVYGNASAPRKCTEDGFTMCYVERCDEEIHQMVKEYFTVESLGVKVTDQKLSSKENDRAQQVMEAATVRDGSNWKTGLIWKQDNLNLPPSKSNALKRLYSMEKKMDKDPSFAKRYNDQIEYYLANGYAKYLTTEEAAVTTPRTWYLPHFGVSNPNKPEKFRLVFDAAAKSSGISLNDMLLPGPDLLTSLPGCLIKFRQGKIGFSGDIKDFFHRVHIREEDQSSQRFLWRGMDRIREPDTMAMTVSIFGATCSPFTSQAAKNKNAEDFQQEFPDAAVAIVDRHYMDDYLDSADTKEEATKRIQNVTEVHRRGGFEIGKWSCSSKEVLKKIPPKLRAEEGKGLLLEGEMKTERVLGLTWNPNKDTLGFDLKFHKLNSDIVEGERRPTKREVLKMVMSIFDPLGLLAHLSVQGKILLQDIWRSGLGWDDDLTEDLNKKWMTWIEQIRNISSFNVRRCYRPEVTKQETTQLHVFCDASEKAYAAVIYIRLDNGISVETSIVMGKTRVAPLKPITIPRMELQAALMGSRLADFVKRELEWKVEATHFWTDSRTVLCWLRSEARNFKTFVAHRVGEILELTDVSSWHWVPTKENVAHEATRDSKPVDIQPESRWVRGPKFLRKTQQEWPSETCLDKQEDKEREDDLERKESMIALIEPWDSCLPDTRRFSSWLKLIRATAWVLRFIKVCREKVRKGRLVTELSNLELQEAEKLWWKQVQRESFQQEVSALGGNKSIDPSSPLKGLSPYMDEEGVLRMRGRIGAAPGVDASTKQPVILPQKHPYTKLLINHYHSQAGHHGQERVVNDLRRKFWILNLRTAVRSAWNFCQKCKNSRAQPHVPEMGPLPAVRLTSHVTPFTFTGVDYFGPMEVSVGRRREKRYGVLFTCLTTRAVHLELAASLTTDSAIMAIRRMVSRRGLPKELHSDNGTNLKGADAELRLALKALDNNNLLQEMSSRGIAWHFIPPASPHMGGCWESLVRSVKTALKATLKERAPKEEMLQTLLIEAENIVNSRPLTHVSVDPDDPVALTPNDILIGTPRTNLPPGKFSEEDLYSRKQWRYTQQLINNFWKRWVTEYLPTLTKRSKWFRRVDPIKVGDLVIIADNSLERNSWPKGVITATFPGKDGQVRVADVKTQSGTYRRPASKICVLDVTRRSSGVARGATPGESMSATAHS